MLVVQQDLVFSLLGQHRHTYNQFCQRTGKTHEPNRQSVPIAGKNNSYFLQMDNNEKVEIVVFSTIEKQTINEAGQNDTGRKKVGLLVRQLQDQYSCVYIPEKTIYPTDFLPLYQY